ncbi:malate/lactate/ureidoglycolate dehydrogenase [Ramlibacter sp. RBP-2]|uniref:Malate/lactate/ureidoglycolate dehydrogenase n=1 Tax=Ramlibacter lithotrophicus TaxID=2606681 RepID=A0A7X6I6R5_9BURK|nr:malate/lactate/ureidoglycolate dehydrogenase [Ramlibacter lithotrophicus]NKE66384.1 malate/lactate/ureidoglycolate dehydrogenase [Ramlibacter lithotrophicus]
MARNFQAGALRQDMARVLQAAGSSGAEARQVADNLVMANLSGHDSHGIGMIPRYVESIQEGGLQPNAAIKVNFDGGAMLAIDGQHGYGQVVGVQAMELAMERAAQHGSCIMALGEAHHLGRIGHFAEMAVARGLVSIHFVNVLSRPVVAAWGGSDGRFGTNPCCIGIPLKGRDPFVLDFATSRVAQGKMRVAHNEGREVPEGYLIDEHGRPTTRPGVVVVPQSNGLLGALLPFGEHKGYGMAIACELLGGALSGGGTWHRKPDMRREVLNGMVTILIDPQRLGTGESFEQEAAAFMEWLKESPPAQGFDAVRIAGDPEREARIKRERDGILVDDQTWAEIVAAGKKVGLSDLPA